MRAARINSWVLIFVTIGTLSGPAENAPAQDTPSGKLTAVLDYISNSWSILTRSTTTCVGVEDIKLAETETLYLPAEFPIPPSLTKLTHHCRIRVDHLPFSIRGPGQISRNGIKPPGLLFLENPYVVPGGRFNEMYGWDSYFIIRGLLREGKLDLARGMVENFFFEIEHYGGILNANRTYYLTRSQPPFLSSMVMAVYEAGKSRGQASNQWLARAYRYVERDYRMWTEDEHLAGTTGLSRYYDFGQGPVPEGLHDETGYYHDVLAYFLKDRKQNQAYLAESPDPKDLPFPGYSAKVCKDENAPDGAPCKQFEYVSLSPEYYEGDRSMRESGFDITFRFGPYGADTQNYAPVCLNSLLYKTETDMETMSEWLGDTKAAAQWHERSTKRRELIDNLLWNGKTGMYFDYEFKSKQLSTYAYATTFYPLWAGIATPAEAKAVVNNLHLFEQEGGLAMSTKETGVQWDYPYGWAPIQLLAVEGLRRYGYNDEANRISAKFLSMVLANFERDGNLREKYDVVTDSSNVQLAEGYRGNIIGFGWTNAVFLELLQQLPREWIKQIGQKPESSRQ
jgi:alpha,alpha-trehalase